MGPGFWFDPQVRLGSWAKEKGVGTCISRHDDRECELVGSHTGECYFGICSKTWNGLSCDKDYGHGGGCSFVPRCEGGA